MIRPIDWKPQNSMFLFDSMKRRGLLHGQDGLQKQSGYPFSKVSMADVFKSYCNWDHYRLY